MSYTPETNSSHLKIGLLHPKRNESCEPTIDFHGLLSFGEGNGSLMVWGPDLLDCWDPP